VEIPRISDEAEARIEQQFGAYRIVRLLGEGGMGTVYLAEQQQPIRRQVALKVIKLGMNTTEVMARFESERQALALMDHANIARVFDAGSTEQGRPYFVMEYVSGIPITEYCDLHRLNNHERLELFIAVCQAVHHAHQKGIIHRDIKPSNVLVGEQDGKPLPKVIDFGIAKAIDQRVMERATFTEMGSLVGTPEYMSPEQTLLSSNIDTTTDVYSLGVLLYELLAGALPFEGRRLREAGLAELLRVIREEDPPTPSEKVSHTADLAGVAERRSTNPVSLRRQLNGDLNWIVMKALEKDRGRRYSSVSEIAADIRRHLENKPVLAGPPSGFYWARKFVLRHRLAVTSGLLVGSALLAGLIAVTWEMRVAESRRHEAEWQSYIANVNAAELHLRLGDADLARRRLLVCPTELRGWEWGHLLRQTDGSLATLDVVSERDNYRDHMPPFVFSDEGHRILWYTKHTLLAWDAKTYQPVARYAEVGAIIAISSDATKIIAQGPALAGQPGHALNIFEAISGKRIVSLEEKGEADFALFHSRSARVAGMMHDGRMIIWDANSGRAVRSIMADPLFISCAVFSPDGRRIALGSSDNTVMIWDATSGRLLTTLKGHTGRIRAVDFSPDSSQLATGSEDGTIRTWDVPAQRSLLTLGGNYGNVYSIVYSPDGSRIAAGTEDSMVRVWDTASGRQISTISGNEYKVESIAFTPDGAHILTAHRLGSEHAPMGPTLRVWDVSFEPGIKMLVGHRSGVSAVAFSSNDRFLASASSDVRIWETGSGSVFRVLAGHGPIAFSPDGQYLASGWGEGSIRIWDYVRGDAIRTFRAHKGYVSAIAFSPDGTRLASGSQDKTVKVWNVKVPGEPVTMVLPGPVGSLVFSPNGHHLLSASGDQGTPIVQVWDADSKLNFTIRDDSGRRALDSNDRPRFIATTSGYSPGRAVYSPNGLQILSTGLEPHIKIWESNSGKAIVSLPTSANPSRHPVPLRSISWHPDGKRIALSEGKDIQIWDAISHELVITLRSNELSGPILDTIRCLMFSHNGELLASGSEDGTVRIWDTVRNLTVHALQK